MLIKAKIRWFDSVSGLGMVRLNNKQTSHYLHFTSIKGIEKNNYHYPTKTDQQILQSINDMDCLVELYENEVLKCIITNPEFPKLIIESKVSK